MSLNPHVWKILAENNHNSIQNLKQFLDLENEYIGQQTLLLTTQIYIYRMLYQNDDDHDFEYIEDLPDPPSSCNSSISTTLLNTLIEIKNCNNQQYDCTLTYILIGFAYLKFVENILLNNEPEKSCISINLCKAREYLEKSEEMINCNNNNNNNNNNPIFMYKYLSLWGKGMCNYFNSFVVKDERMKLIFIKKSCKQLLEAFHYYTLSDEENERLPFIGDTLVDMSPFYIGDIFERIGDKENAEIFIKLSILENNIPTF